MSTSGILTAVDHGSILVSGVTMNPLAEPWKVAGYEHLIRSFHSPQSVERSLMFELPSSFSLQEELNAPIKGTVRAHPSKSGLSFGVWRKMLTFSQPTGWGSRYVLDVATDTACELKINRCYLRAGLTHGQLKRTG